MASKRPSFMKRQRERDLKEKRQAKIDRRTERQNEKPEPGVTGDPDVDPDIAHIQPGPQPIPWMMDPE